MEIIDILYWPDGSYVIDVYDNPLLWCDTAQEAELFIIDFLLTDITSTVNGAIKIADIHIYKSYRGVET